MQSLYHVVQTWSNLLHSNSDLYMNYDLVTHLALAMNTKVVHNDTLNMFKLFARSQSFHALVTHRAIQVNPYTSLKCLIMKGDIHEQGSIC